MNRMIFLKLLIVIIFLAMSEIPYIVKLMGVTILGTIIIIDWYSDEEE